MRKVLGVLGLFLCFLFSGLFKAQAHFGGIIPSDDIITQGDEKDIQLKIMFFHPMENSYMDMERPKEFGVLYRGERINLLKTLEKKDFKGHLAWEATYRIRRPGDYIFYVVPQPYWEPAEDKYILHYTKVCVNALGLEEGWDKEVGLETEIIPLSRPYGLWTGNIFRGMVKVKGKPSPFAEIEVEYYNKDGKIIPPAEPYITQVIKADEEGIFSYAMPKAGWWGFAALNEADWKLKDPQGEDKPVEIGAVFWVRVEDLK